MTYSAVRSGFSCSSSGVGGKSLGERMFPRLRRRLDADLMLALSAPFRPEDDLPLVRVCAGEAAGEDVAACSVTSAMGLSEVDSEAGLGWWRRLKMDVMMAEQARLPVRCPWCTLLQLLNGLACMHPLACR